SISFAWGSPSLKTQSRVQLYDSRPSRAEQLAEELVIDTRSQATQVRVVECIEHVGPQLELHPLGNREVFRQRKVQVPGAGGADQPISGASRSDGGARGLVHRHRGESRPVEIL